jgi:hypothetical protein
MSLVSSSLGCIELTAQGKLIEGPILDVKVSTRRVSQLVSLNNASMAPQNIYCYFVWLALLVCGSQTLAPAPRVVSTNSDSELNASYDYVVIGGGTSGLVVANRLTEDPDSKQHSTSITYSVRDI